MSIFLRAVYYLLEVVSYMLIARVLLSWFPQVRQSKFFAILFQLTEPLLMPIRKLLSRTKAGEMPIDLSVIIAYLIIAVIQMIIVPFM
ncbi:MAG: YggT family protein [Clostridia bacterium]|nr:YggT family protein [Clostridia bacterium]